VSLPIPRERPVAVGDWVLVEGDRIVEVLPRRTAVVRADADGRSIGQVLASNLDSLLVCTPLAVDARLSRVERLLAVAWASGATPVVVATKADECADPEAALSRLATAAPGVQVIATSVVDGRGLDEVRALAGPGRTIAVIGASGVGKSSLANALLGADALAVRDVRTDGKGRHTTAWRELVPLPSGGAFIDTPGLRSIGLYDADDGIRLAYADVEALLGGCRFNDCRHDVEPGCAITEAVADGLLDAGRVQRWHKLRREAAWQQSKTDARLRAERARRWKQIARAARTHDSRP
jgi:ribosome biogenesis GTPase